MIGMFLALATAASSPAPICADRPSKANGSCTVPAAHLQIETGLVDWTHNRADGVRSDFAAWGGTFFKYGLGERTDVELGLTPLETLHVRAGGEHDSKTGVGDTVVRVKQRLTGDDGPVQVAIIPFVKVPTARHAFGNGKVEGGLAIPLSTALGKTVTVTLGPELDARADGDGHGYHLAMAQLVNLGFAASPRLSLSAELWSQWDWDPHGTAKQASADASGAYLVNNDLQLDAGANLGLNHQTADIELYVGVSKRF